ncbi:MAG TPA: 6-carboxytetrahydropterin synthase QueD [Smithellaceae bacterium]|nr:6-carboxytetrahydropterin synthase QueD [Smithellaceae bacterium]
MYEVSIIKSFSAAHMLKAVGGKCEELHGHNFKVEATVTAQELDQSGISIDFRNVKEWLQEILGTLDHKHLNELTSLLGENPSSENIALYIYKEMKLKVRRTELKVSRVKVWESESAAVTYKEND